MESVAAQAPAIPQPIFIADGWRLTLSSESLDLTKEGEQGYHLPRATVLEHIERFGLDLSTPFFAVLSPKRRVFKLGKIQADQLNAWLGPDFRPELRHQVRLRIMPLLSGGLFYLLTGPKDPVSLGLGALLILQAVLGRFRPAPWLFLLNALFWAVFAVKILARWSLARSGFGMAFDMVVLMLAVGGIGFGLQLFARLSPAIRRYRP